VTWTVIAASAAITGPLAVVGTVAFLRAAGVLEVDVEQAIRDGVSSVGIPTSISGLRIAEGFLALVALPLAVVGLILTLGLVALRAWAREAAIGVFGLSGAFLALLGVYGLAQDTPGENSLVGLLAGLTVGGVAGLLLSPPCSNDVDRAETARRVRAMRAAEQARLAARDSRAGAGRDAP
jgi:hypothetical protein